MNLLKRLREIIIQEFELPCKDITSVDGIGNSIETEVVYVELKEIQKNENVDKELYELRGKIYILLGQDEDSWTHFYKLLSRRSHFLTFRPIFEVSIHEQMFYILNTDFASYIEIPPRRTLYVKNIANIGV